MSETSKLQKEAMEMLLATSRTFYIPISRLSPGLQEAVASAYLCMRAIDEIEDHPQLPSDTKVKLLKETSKVLQKPFSDKDFTDLFHPFESVLPEVTLRLGDWARLAPESIAQTIYDSTAKMSNGMADWVAKEWIIHTREDLDDYTYYVAGLVGELLSDIWMWHDQTKTDRELAVAFGRGLQAVNIIRNRVEDQTRGVNFFPDNWELSDMLTYARGQLQLAHVYTESLRPGPILLFCKIPLVLAQGTLDAIESGQSKLSRDDVVQLVNQVSGE
ncbi:squalene/phytoene synthase family protein [Ammoniphilus sp. CFH 90114]|uniref:squalene/phytoene synthase family protein n=1 Tax=Ammoniphilus sp. CFH 90114 TaxID=2493665 RepID=UPI00100F77D5|nr:phytoene/squalene synthase family protein [Ammoniphilus sp. CFH 90114]RXT15327.1 phytoene/squalene synthase family protein [Ammoniphilus sp. CFH 90114]